LSKILVTGGTGFVGSYVIKLLVEKGYQVRALRRAQHLPVFIPSRVWDTVEWVEGDVLDVVSLEDAMQGVDAIVHSAAIVSFHRKERKKMFQVNVDGTANVVNMSLQCGVPRLIHMSSVAAIGRTAHGGKVNEEKQWQENNVNTDYARSKFKAELEVWRGEGEGLSTVILNPSTVLGYGDWSKGSCRIFKNIYEEFPWYTEGVNGFVDVEDVARLVELMLRSPVREQRFIVNGETWPFRQLMERIAFYFGKRPPRRKIGPALMSVAWRFERFRAFFTGSAPLLTKESAKVALSRTWFLSDKLRDAIPEFSFTPLEETLRNACEKYLADVRELQP